MRPSLVRAAAPAEVGTGPRAARHLTSARWSTVDNQGGDHRCRSNQLYTLLVMPSQMHEAFVEFVRQRPAFVADILTGPLKMELPDFQHLRLDSIDFTDITPTEYRADAVVTFTDDIDRPVFAVVIEAQLDRASEKRLTWPVYVTTLRARLKCTTALLVLCGSAGVARWCAEPIDVAYPDCVLTPLVLGPDTVPVVTDPAQARRNPEMTVLSLMAHGGRGARSDQRKDLIRALLVALKDIDQDHRRLYYDVALAGLPVQAHQDLEDVLMKIEAEPEFRSEFLRTFFDKHKAISQAKVGPKVGPKVKPTP